MNRETFRKLQPNTRIVINNRHNGKTVGRKGIVSKIISKTDGTVRIHLDGNNSTNVFHYSKLDLVEEPVTVPKIETSVDEATKSIEENDEESEEVLENKTEAPEVEEKDEAISTPIDPGD